MTRDWSKPLSTEPSPGTYRTKLVKNGPHVAVRLMRSDDGRWTCLVNGVAERGSGALDPFEITTILWNWPFTSISEDDYAKLIEQHRGAKASDPITDTGAPVDLKGAKSLW